MDRLHSWFEGQGGKDKRWFLAFFLKELHEKLDEHEMEPVSYKISASDFVWSGYHIFAAVLVVVVMVAFKILSRIELAVSKPRFDLMKYKKKRHCFTNLKIYIARNQYIWDSKWQILCPLPFLCMIYKGKCVK